MDTVSRLDETRLLHHGDLLADRNWDAATAIALAPGLDGETASLMALAAHIPPSLPAVRPSDAFRTLLGRELVDLAHRRRRFLPRLANARPWRAALNRRAADPEADQRTARRVFGSGAAVALLGLFTLWFSSRGIRLVRGWMRGRSVVPAASSGSQAT